MWLVCLFVEGMDFVPHFYVLSRKTLESLISCKQKLFVHFLFNFDENLAKKITLNCRTKHASTWQQGLNNQKMSTDSHPPPNNALCFANNVIRWKNVTLHASFVSRILGSQAPLIHGSESNKRL